MNEETVLALLSQRTKMLLNQFEGSLRAEEHEEIAEHVADATWNALVLLLRHSIGRSQPAILEEVGCFKRSETGVDFEPAASLLEAASLNLRPSEAHRWLAEQAVFYLTQGVKLLDTIPRDLALEINHALIQHAKKEIKEELLAGIFGESNRPLKLSDIAYNTAVCLKQIAYRLGNHVTEQPLIPPVEHVFGQFKIGQTVKRRLEREHELRGEAEAQD